MTLLGWVKQGFRKKMSKPITDAHLVYFQKRKAFPQQEQPAPIPRGLLSLVSVVHAQKKQDENGGVGKDKAMVGTLRSYYLILQAVNGHRLSFRKIILLPYREWTEGGW